MACSLEKNWVSSKSIEFIHATDYVLVLYKAGFYFTELFYTQRFPSTKGHIV